MMEIILSGLHWKRCIVYIDDIILFSTTFEDHLTTIREVFDALTQANLKIKPSKCTFVRPELHFLGHVISAKGISPNPDKIIALKSYPVPKIRKQVQAFLGLVNWFKRYTGLISRLAIPLHNLIKKDVPFRRSSEHQSAFEQLKAQFTSTPILQFPCFSPAYTFILAMDASDFALGAVLRQRHDTGSIGIIAYASRALKAAERNYTTTEKEALAVVWACKYFRYYLLGRHFIVETDHNSLRWLINVKDPSCRLRRWGIQLQEYTYTIRYVNGKLNQAADILSRNPIHQPTVNVICVDPNLETETPDESSSPPEPSLEPVLPNLTPTTHQQASSRDPWIQHILTELSKPIPNPTLTDRYYLHDSCHNHQQPPTKKLTHPPQLVIPQSLRQTFLSAFHDSIFGGHFSAHNTLQTIQQKYWWPKMESDIITWTRNCAVCLKRAITPKHTTYLKTITVTPPWDMIACDCLSMPISDSGNHTIVVFMDYFSKFPEAFPVADIKATTIADLLLQEIIPRHGCPRHLLTAQGTNFTSHLLMNVCKLLRLHKMFMTPYHPQTDGMVERFNHTLINTLSKLSAHDEYRWEKYPS